MICMKNLPWPEIGKRITVVLKDDLLASNWGSGERLELEAESDMVIPAGSTVDLIHTDNYGMVKFANHQVWKY